MPWIRPSGPSATCSTSLGPGSEVKTASTPSATCRGVSSRTALALRCGAAASFLTSLTCSSWPPACRLDAMLAPMVPRPMNPTFMPSSPSKTCVTTFAADIALGRPASNARCVISLPVSSVVTPLASARAVRPCPPLGGLSETRETRRILPRERRLDHGQCALPHLRGPLRPSRLHHVGGVLRRLPPRPHDDGLLRVGAHQRPRDGRGGPGLHGGGGHAARPAVPPPPGEGPLRDRRGGGPGPARGAPPLPLRSRGLLRALPQCDVLRAGLRDGVLHRPERGPARLPPFGRGGGRVRV